MMRRRKFITQGLKYTTGAALLPLKIANADLDLTKVTILHTNDVHSRIEPFPMDGSRNAGKGGALRRAVKIEEIRKLEEHVLLLDAGDIFQGTPYFNFFYGEVEIKLMSEMGYDAATIGNHDFDGGIENLANQLKKGSFQMLNSNYILKDTPLAEMVQPYKIFDKGGVKIGVYALGIELNGLVPVELYGNAVYEDPIKAARRWEHFLKNEEKCDYVICLSHLGFQYRGDKVSDVKIALNTADTDLIIGGHTHTFMDDPDIYFNRRGNQVLINQVGWAGLMLGRIDLTFEKNKKNKCVTCKNIWLEENF